MSFVPPALEKPLQEALHSIGDDSAVTGTRAVGGGCINNAMRLDTQRAAYLLKWNADPLPDMFPMEVEGLREMHATHTVRVPEPYAAENPKNGAPGFILMEWLEAPQGARRVDFEQLGRQLAQMHRHGPKGVETPTYGLAYDNYIGPTRQLNGWDPDWVNFYREKRLRPQMDLAQRSGKMPSGRRKALERVMARLDEWLSGVARQPSLIHGDLWGGNVMAGPDGPALIDPAVYYADREAEIAYTELFGGFNSRFYAAYREAWPLEPGYRERRDLYNLYHLLNHLNIFGELYGYQVEGVLRKYS